MASARAPAVVLASASPRRRLLLEELGIPFDIEVSSFDEVVDPDTPIAKLVDDLAFGKAADVYSRRPLDIVIGADTLVVFEGKYLGKPDNEQSAIDLLRKMSGEEISVFTGLAVIAPSYEKRTVVEIATTITTIDGITLTNYIESGIYKDKAGGVSVEIVDQINGPIDAVLGLPLSEVAQALRANGVTVSTARY